LSDGVEAAVAVFGADDDGVIVAVNSAAVKLTGYTAHELLGQHFHMLVPHEDAGVATRAFEEKRRNAALETSYEIRSSARTGRGAP
jgi:PAS domain S-box-containing protein